jgi:hypothetical protein
MVRVHLYCVLHHLRQFRNHFPVLVVPCDLTTNHLKGREVVHGQVIRVKSTISFKDEIPRSEREANVTNPAGAWLPV